MNRSTLNEAEKLQEDDACPKCNTGHLEHRRHRFSTEGGSSLPDADWLQCSDCYFATDPE